MPENRLARFWGWLRDAPTLAGHGCSTGSPARIPRRKPTGSGSGARRGCGARSQAWMSMGPAAMPLDLDDDERAALVELLTGEMKGTRYPLSPRLRPLKSLLAKLGVGSTHATVYPPPKPPGQPSSVLGKKRQHDPTALHRRIGRSLCGATWGRTARSRLDRLDEGRVVVLDVADALAHRPACHPGRWIGHQHRLQVVGGWWLLATPDRIEDGRHAVVGRGQTARLARS